MITVPRGERVTAPAVAAATGRAFAAIARAVPHVRIADYATTRDPAFITRDGRSTFALVYTAPISGFGGSAIQHTLTAAVPPGWRIGVTGSPLLQNGKPTSKGTGVMAEAMIGSLGALLVLAFVFASFLALLPLLIGGISVLATFLLVGGLTEVTGVSQIVEFLIALIGLGVAIDYSLLVVTRWREERAAIVTVIPVTESSVPAGQATISRLEDTLLTNPHVTGVGGEGASLIDFDHAVYGDFPLMLALIGVATFLLLTRAFRSVLLAAKAVTFNLVSLAAAYGVLTWVWQDGHGSTALWGIPAAGVITMWVPLMVFAFLFGLSMDYEVFILTRIREVYDATGDARHAVTEGLGRTGRLVTCAAAILMLSFLSMSTGPQTDLKILATGLGAGILIDAIVIRCLLVPAMVALFGGANWWLPAPVARLLRVPAPVHRRLPVADPAEPVPALTAVR